MNISGKKHFGQKEQQAQWPRGGDTLDKSNPLAKKPCEWKGGGLKDKGVRVLEVFQDLKG